NLRRESIIKNSITSLSKEKKFCCVKGCFNTWYSDKYGNYCQEHHIQMRKDYNRYEKKNKEKVVKNELSIIKNKEKELHKEKTGNRCEGCGQYHSNLDYSHILSVKQRKDLELEKDNKNLLCRQCHENWESRNAQKMLSLECFYNNMKYIRSVDKERFWKIYFIFNDELMINECNKLEEIDNEFKK